MEVKLLSDVDIRTILEATLFGAGRSLSVEELAESIQISHGEVIANLESLQHTMKRRPGGALQLTSVSGRWVMEVKPKLAKYLNAYLQLPRLLHTINRWHRVSWLT